MEINDVRQMPLQRWRPQIISQHDKLANIRLMGNRIGEIAGVAGAIHFSTTNILLGARAGKRQSMQIYQLDELPLRVFLFYPGKYAWRPNVILIFFRYR